MTFLTFVVFLFAFVLAAVTSTEHRAMRELRALDRALKTKGFPPLSPWWRETFARFLASGRLQAVIRIARRGGKSSSLCRFAVAWALWFVKLGLVAPGDVGWITFVSVSREEAAARLYTIASILRAIGTKYHEDGDTIIISGSNIGFRVLTCSIAGVSGWTSILIICDEVARWRDASTGANPAREVLAALRPTGAMHRAPVILSSSPYTEIDAHARAFDDGDNEHQTVFAATTWEANPTITEEQTRTLEPDERIWRREYANVPSAATLDGYLADVTRGCVDRGRWSGSGEYDPRNRHLVSIDAAWRADEHAYAVVHVEHRRSGLPVVIVDEVGGWRAARGQVLHVETIVERISTICEKWHADRIYADQKDFDSLSAIYARRNITLVGCAWTAQNKPAKYKLFRSLAIDGRVRLPDERILIGQLESICIKILPSGTETFEGRGPDDRASAVVLGVAEALGTPGRLTMLDALRYRTTVDGGSIHHGFAPSDLYTPEELEQLKRFSR